jgi:branched-chain amino acid transport system substrate-binding protein
MKKTLAMCVVMAGLLLVELLAASAQAQIPARIRMGMLVALNGPAAATDYSFVAGTHLAVAEINKAGGIAGKPIDLITGDSQGDPLASVNEVRRLVGPEHIDVLIGPINSQILLAVAPVLNQAKIANIGTSGASSITPQVANWNFGIIPTSDAQVMVMVDYAIDHLKAKNIAWIGDNGAQALLGMQVAKTRVAERHANLVAEQQIQFHGTDVMPQMLSIKRANPDVLLMWPNSGEDHALIIKARDELGWNIPIVNGGGSALATATANKVYPNAFKDIPSTMLKSWSYCPGDAMGSGELARFAERLKAAEGDNYSKVASNYAAWTYDAVYVFKAAIEGAGTVDGPTLTKWIEQNVSKVKGVSGAFAATSSNHFLFSDPNAISMVDTSAPRADGRYRRISGC